MSVSAMKLSSTPLHSWKFLLLLLSTLLLWENVASQHMCAMRNGKCQLTLSDLFSRAVMVSNYFNIQCARMFTELDKAYRHGWGLKYLDVSSCPTAKLTTPENREETKWIQPEVLLKVTVSMLEAWNQPLEYLVTDANGLIRGPESLLTRAKEVFEKYQVLLEGMKIIQSKFPATLDEELSMPMLWEGKNLLMSNEDTRLSVLYNMFYCLRRDSHKISTYIWFLRCQIVPGEC